MQRQSRSWAPSLHSFPHTGSVGALWLSLGRGASLSVMRSILPRRGRRERPQRRSRRCPRSVLLDRGDVVGLHLDRGVLPIAVETDRELPALVVHPQGLL